MKTIKILVEGTRDVALLASIFKVCNLNLSDMRALKKDKDSKKQRPWYEYEFKLDGLVGEYEGENEGARQRLEVYITGGYSKFNDLLSVYEDKDGNGVIPAVVYDADSSADDENHGGNTARRTLLQEQYDGHVFQRKPNDELSIFLFPNNRDDGNIETLLEMISAKGSRKAMTVCWRIYEWLLSMFHYFKPTAKSKINEYTSATIGPEVWEYQGQNKALFSQVIWDWRSRDILPLCEFIKELVNKV